MTPTKSRWPPDPAEHIDFRGDGTMWCKAHGRELKKLTSGTDQSFGRKFHKCSMPPEQACKAWIWDDLKGKYFDEAHTPQLAGSIRTESNKSIQREDHPGDEHETATLSSHEPSPKLSQPEDLSYPVPQTDASSSQAPATSQCDTQSQSQSDSIAPSGSIGGKGGSTCSNSGSQPPSHKRSYAAAFAKDIYPSGQNPQLLQEIAERDRDLASKERELVNKDKQLVEKDRQLVDKDRELAEKDMLLNFKSKQYAKLRRMLVASLEDDQGDPQREI
ncbi:hypothetical protein AX16_010626 [Volvariella volvacea WC 439]|nr:hypothetical protein AX16_010626 [Volvariella volvacea WC 439]